MRRRRQDTPLKPLPYVEYPRCKSESDRVISSRCFGETVRVTTARDRCQLRAGHDGNHWIEIPFGLAVRWTDEEAVKQ